MEKKISVKNLYLLMIICIGLICLGVGSTYAIFTTSAEIESPITLVSNLTYDSNIIETMEIEVPAGEKITSTLNITNSSGTALNYITWYIEEGLDISVGASSGTPIGSLENENSASVVVEVKNNGTSEIVVTLGISSGTGSIVLGDNMTAIGEINYLMEVTSSQTETSTFLRSTIARNEISSITFVDNNIVPEGMTGVDVSMNEDGTVMLWYGDKNSSDLYDIYIGGKNEKVYMYSGSYLFQNLSNCTSINFNDLLDTSSVTNMRGMFELSHNIEQIDVSNWDTRNVTDMSNMFSLCTNLTTIYVSDKWSTTSVTNSASMFANCTSLVGGKGTVFDASHNDKEYAHVDGGTANRGYLTKCISLTYDNVLPGETVEPQLVINNKVYEGYTSIKYEVISGTEFASISNSTSGVISGNADGIATVKVTITASNGSVITVTARVVVGKPELESISVTTAPTKTQYNIGDPFDSTGMVVTATYTDGTKVAITDYTYYSKSADGWLNEDDTSITITYTEAGVTKIATQAIEVGYILVISGTSISPDYEYLTINGIVYTSPANVLVAPGTVFTFNYVERSGTMMSYYANEYTATGPMSLLYFSNSNSYGDKFSRIFALSAVDFVTTPPHKIGYEVGESFDPTGMVVTHTYADGTKEIVTDYTYSEISVSNNKEVFQISYERDGTTYSTNVKVHVNYVYEEEEEDTCFAEGTLITLADGTQKPIEEITYEDKLLVWDFYAGTYATSTPSFIEDGMRSNHHVLNLEFSDNTVVRVTDQHGFFDIQANNFVFLNESNVNSYVGHKFIKAVGDGTYGSVELIGYSVTVEDVKFYTVMTAIHNNCIADGMLTLTPPPAGFDGWFEIFEIGEDMKYDEVKMQAEIEKYGLYTYEDFSEYITYEEFIAFNGPYLKILVGKGVTTFDQILDLISIYVPD